MEETYVFAVPTMILVEVRAKSRDQAAMLIRARAGRVLEEDESCREFSSCEFVEKHN